MATDVTPVKPHTGSIQNYNTAVRASSGDSRSAYQQDLLGYIEYRSQKPIKAYETWSITGIDAVVKTIEESIRAGNDLKEFQQNVRDKVEEKYLYPQLVSMHLFQPNTPHIGVYITAKYIPYNRGCSSDKNRI